MKKLFFAFLVILVQIADVAVHAFIGELEILRVIANIAILVLAFAVIFKRAEFIIVATGLAAYVILNFVFVINNGILNSEGGLRVALICFVVATIAVCAWILKSLRPSRNK